jgi:hypothetical protein
MYYYVESCVYVCTFSSSNDNLVKNEKIHKD